MRWTELPRRSRARPSRLRRPSFRSRPRSCTACWGEHMKASELRAKSDDELKKELGDLLKAQFSLRMQLATQQLAKTSQVSKVRRDIARVRTVLKEKSAK